MDGEELSDQGDIYVAIGIREDIPGKALYKVFLPTRPLQRVISATSVVSRKGFLRTVFDKVSASTGSSRRAVSSTPVIHHKDFPGPPLDSMSALKRPSPRVVSATSVICPKGFSGTVLNDVSASTGTSREVIPGVFIKRRDRVAGGIAFRY
jgi:hypothetical protein